MQNCCADWRRWFGLIPAACPANPASAKPEFPSVMLIEHLAAGFSLDEFLETVPSLEREKAQEFLRLAGEQMLECASSLTNA